MAPLRWQGIIPGYQGLDTDTAPDNLADGFAPVHENFVVHRNGLLQMRGPLVNHTALDLGSNEIVAGAWYWNNKVLVGLVAASVSATGEPWTGHYRKVSAEANLALGETTMKLVDLDALTVSNVSAGVTQANIIGGRGARLGGHTYGIAYASSAASVNENGGRLWLRKLLRWDGTTTAPTAYTNAPEGAQDIRTHLNRLFVLGGRSNHIGSSLTTIQANALYFSDNVIPAAGLADAASSWQNDATGLLNIMIVDSDNANDFGVGLAKVGDNLVIFKRRSVHILYGYSSDTFQLRTVTSDIGCLDQRSIVEYEDGCYFLSDQGYMWFDGEQIVNTSENLRTSLAVAGAQTVGDAGVDGGRAVATKLANDYVLLSIQKQTFSTGAQVADSSRFCALMHTPTGRWSKFSSDATANPTPVHVSRTLSQPYLIDGTRVQKCHLLTAPEQAAEADRGYDKVGGASPSTQEIPSKWWSALYQLSTPPYYSQLHRFMFDYGFVVDGAADGAHGGWYVQLVDGTGTVLHTEYQVPSAGDPTGYLFRRRDVADSFNEAGECQVRVEWRGTGTPLALVKAEIYGGTIEFSTARQRRSS
jgi:hypothetical protein